MQQEQKGFRYRKLADTIWEEIKNGTYRPGDKLPSIRSLQQRSGLSLTTVHQAYADLESSGVIEARPRSGFYVTAAPLDGVRPPLVPGGDFGPREVKLDAMVNSVVNAIASPELVPLGSSAISAELLPYKFFSRILKGITAAEMKSCLSYAPADGLSALRTNIAKRVSGVTEATGADEIIITNGCMEAVALSLMATTSPGDTVAIETPTHFGFLQLINELGLYVVEVPTHPVRGVDAKSLEKVIDKNNITVCLFMPNFHNPLGASIPEPEKKEIVKLLTKHDIPVIEDDICSELYHNDKGRPGLLKTYDKKDLVITCSSFSKTLAPGFRTGWVMAGERYREKIRRLKAGTTVSTSTLDQYILSQYLNEGGYDRHLRRLRNTLKKQTLQTALCVREAFPEHIRFALPEGGALLWIQLGGNADGTVVYRKALEENISILPGSVCSTGDRFRNFIRIGCGSPVTDKIEQGIEKLGKIVKGLS